jgi:hypothetical protein
MAKYLITADPIATFQPRFDTTLRLMAELRARAIDVDYCDLLACDPHRASADYLAALPVHSVVRADPARQPCVDLGPRRLADARDYAVLIHRKDPPVDALYRAHASHFARSLPASLSASLPASLSASLPASLPASLTASLSVPPRLRAPCRSTRPPRSCATRSTSSPPASPTSPSPPPTVRTSPP